MEGQFAEYKKLGEAIALHGQNFVEALVILVVGLIVIKMLTRLLRRILERLGLKPQMVSTVNSIFYIILLFIVVAAALQQAGMATIVIRRILIATGLAAVGLIAVFRPLLPTLPFKVGNTVKVGDLL